jgi:hypothetical protein
MLIIQNLVGATLGMSTNFTECSQPVSPEKKHLTLILKILNERHPLSDSE